MKRSWWSVSLTTLVLSSLLLMSACGGSNSTPNNSNKGGNGTSEATQEPRKDGEQVVIRHTMYDTEFTSELVAEFEKTHPHIKVELVSADYNKLMAMMAAGNSPDIIRTNSVTELPGFVLKEMALDLTDNFKESKVFDIEDFLPVVNQFKYDIDSGKHGEGAIYGFPKDWSPDYTIYYNKKMFEEAGVPVPSSTEAMTWQELTELGQKLTVKNGKKTSQYGLVYYNSTIAANQDLLNLQLLQQGSSMFTEDYNQAALDKPETKDLLNFWVETAKSGIGPSPLQQETDWGGQLFVDNKAAIIIAGYWFSGFLKTNELTKDRLDDFGVAPAPMVEGGERISPTGAGTGAVIYKGTKHPKEAWEVFEWFFGAEPAVERAKAGYGLPGTKTLTEMLPQESAFDKMNFDFIQNELQYTDGSLPYNPYLNYQAVNSIIDKYFTPVYFDKDTVDGAVQKMTEELNTLIQEGKQLVSP